MRTCDLLAVFACLTLSNCALAQSPIPVGKGSYASAPPAEAGVKLQQFDNRPLNLLPQPAGRPIPTNKWWTQLLTEHFGRSLWAYPLKVDTSQDGASVFFPTRYRDDGQDPMSEFPVTIAGQGFQPTDALVKDWSDWMVVFRLAGASSGQYMDFTLGEGMPCVWVEFHGTQPLLKLDGPAQFFRAGAPIVLPSTSDNIGITCGGRSWGVFGPDGAVFSQAPGGLSVTIPGPARYLVLCPLPKESDLEYFHRFAFAIPRKTTYSWKYDPAAGQVTTTWTVTTEPLKGTEKRIIQGWIPHHYRGTVNDLAFNGLEYLSPRGKLRCSVGAEFHITYPYNGILPNLPAPTSTDLPHQFAPGVMHAYLADLAAHPSFGADTYWGGKDILRFGQCALIAQELKDPLQKTFASDLLGAMKNWYTWTPGEKDHFFTYYPRWHSLVGINPSYGSEQFNDHHFHYGYFTFASALLGMQDPQFLADYGGMARLVAQDYANWDHTDRRFPFFRTFDVWAGHSWAGGISSQGGNNQESSSEAMQGWAGIILLGTALGDQDMVAAGVMGYSVESRAVMEYWFNIHGDVFAPNYKHSVAGMVWSGGQLYGTYFSGDPGWVHGIQWLPASPALYYLDRDPAFAVKDLHTMLTEREASQHSATISSMGASLGSVVVGYAALCDPEWAVEQMDALRAANDPIIHNAGEWATIYYLAHASRQIGTVDWSCHTDCATAMAFVNPATHARSYVAWNPSARPVVVHVYQGQKLLGAMTASPQSLTRVTTLMP